MALPASALPFSTPYDASEDPATSIDPLGTVPAAERLADQLFPGLTARMWRARLLTFSALATYVADELGTDADERRLEARLALERMFVFAIARAERRGDPAGEEPARRRLTGIGRAREAIARDEPLTRANFLKGQVINGPIGVMARLARNHPAGLGLVTEDMACTLEGRALLSAWAEDEQLPGLLADARGEKGRSWMNAVRSAVVKWLDEETWPGAQSGLWSALSDRLRLDSMGSKERAAVTRRLDQDPLRKRALDAIIKTAPHYTSAINRKLSRGGIERAVLVSGFLGVLHEDDDVDRRLRSAVTAIDAYESASRLAQQAFDAFVWALTRRHGLSPRSALLDDLARPYATIREELRVELPRLTDAIKGLHVFPASTYELLTRGLEELGENFVAATRSDADLLDAVLARHIEVQRAKRKAPWFDGSDPITLMPGFGLDANEPPAYDPEVFIHPFRVVNGASLLRDLGRLDIRADDGDE